MRDIVVKDGTLHDLGKLLVQLKFKLVKYYENFSNSQVLIREASKIIGEWILLVFLVVGILKFKNDGRFKTDLFLLAIDEWSHPLLGSV